jgi:hypothetical protein
LFLVASAFVIVEEYLKAKAGKICHARRLNDDFMSWVSRSNGQYSESRNSDANVQCTGVVDIATTLR